IRGVPPNAYQHNAEMLALGANTAGFATPEARALLNAFLGLGDPCDQCEIDESISSFQNGTLDHNTGVEWTNDGSGHGTGTIARYVFPSTSSFAGKVLAAPGLRDAVTLILADHKAEVVSWFISNPAESVHDFVFSPMTERERTLDFGSSGANLHFGLGTAA